MEWDREQRQAVFEEIWLPRQYGKDLRWGPGSVECPVDGMPLGVVVEKPALGWGRGHGGEYVRARIECPKCKRAIIAEGRDDPLRASFRPWSVAEKEDIVSRYIRSVTHLDPPRCPIDGSWVDGVLCGAKEGTLFGCLCRRCGNAYSTPEYVMSSIAPQLRDGVAGFF
jgi:hypothetical protein